MASLLSELEQDPFDGHEFVERLAWRCTSGRFDAFDSKSLSEAFDSSVRDLRSVLDSHHNKCDRLETLLVQQHKHHWLAVAHAQERQRLAKNAFSALDSRLAAVAAKVVYLGDQLEGVNTPRARAVEAQRLMRHFSKFLSQDTPLPPDQPLADAADVLQKLHVIAAELPPGPRFERARAAIGSQYDSVEKRLLEEFASAQRDDDRRRMAEMAEKLQHFKGFGQCVDAFIETAQTSLAGRDAFAEVPTLITRTERVVRHVFATPEQIMTKLVLVVFQGKLQDCVDLELSRVVKDDNRFLRSLHALFVKTSQLGERLARTQTLDSAFVSRLSRHVFNRYLEDYVSVETRCLRDRLSAILRRFYDQKGHQKRVLPQTSIQELKRDIQLKIARAAVPTDVAAEEPLLSEEVAIHALQETREALQRCEVLCRPTDLASTAAALFAILLDALFHQHMDYGVELAALSLPAADPRHPPDCWFVEVARQTNAICHLVDKQFVSSVLPLIRCSNRSNSDLSKNKRQFTEQLQQKVNTGLDRLLSSAIAWIRSLLTQEQRKTDFKPETDDVALSSTTSAASKVIRFVDAFVLRVRDGLDGRNVDSFLAEFGVRLHRALFDHFQQFQFSSVGAMVAICDLNEYRRCVHSFGVPLLTSLFAVLHALFNLLVVAPENLKHAVEEVSIERQLVLQFVQLRSDYKTAKVSTLLKL
ncbi:exocyst complex component 5-like [Oppia nitens]|uniref:exocyst complex component 5-like n=1 Tax=Oppia nitens TaxID=1686743 RepID=UPI0023DC8F32|nr:exocyst complex component 5-like [Oppia nitens]